MLLNARTNVFNLDEKSVCLVGIEDDLLVIKLKEKILKFKPIDMSVSRLQFKFIKKAARSKKLAMVFLHSFAQLVVG